MHGHSVGPKLRHETRQCAALLVGVLSTVAQPGLAQAPCDFATGAGHSPGGGQAAEHIPHGAVIMRPGTPSDREVPIMTFAAGDIATSRDTLRTLQTPVAAPHSWTVQVASFEDPGAADRRRRELCAQGYDARIIGTQRPYSVRIGAFASEQAALTVARRLQTSVASVFVTQTE
jgi:sporulation related protein